MEQLEGLAIARLSELELLYNLQRKITEVEGRLRDRTDNKQGGNSENTIHHNNDGGSPNQKSETTNPLLICDEFSRRPTEMSITMMKKQLLREVIRSRKAELIRIAKEREVIEAFQQTQVLSTDMRRSFEQVSVRVMKRINSKFTKELPTPQEEQPGRDRQVNSMALIVSFYAEFFRGIDQEKQAVEIERIFFSHSLCSKFSFVCLLLNQLIEVTRKALKMFFITYNSGSAVNSNNSNYQDVSPSATTNITSLAAIPAMSGQISTSSRPQSALDQNTPPPTHLLPRTFESSHSVKRTQTLIFNGTEKNSFQPTKPQASPSTCLLPFSQQQQQFSPSSSSNSFSLQVTCVYYEPSRLSRPCQAGFLDKQNARISEMVFGHQSVSTQLWTTPVEYFESPQNVSLMRDFHVNSLTAAFHLRLYADVIEIDMLSYPIVSPASIGKRRNMTISKGGGAGLSWIDVNYFAVLRCQLQRNQLSKTTLTAYKELTNKRGGKAALMTAENSSSFQSSATVPWKAATQTERASTTSLDLCGDDTRGSSSPRKHRGLVTSNNSRVSSFNESMSSALVAAQSQEQLRRGLQGANNKLRSLSKKLNDITNNDEKSSDIVPTISGLDSKDIRPPSSSVSKRHYYFMNCTSSQRLVLVDGSSSSTLKTNSSATPTTQRDQQLKKYALGLNTAAAVLKSKSTTTDLSAKKRGGGGNGRQNSSVGLKLEEQTSEREPQQSSSSTSLVRVVRSAADSVQLHPVRSGSQELFTLASRVTSRRSNQNIQDIFRMSNVLRDKSMKQSVQPAAGDSRMTEAIVSSEETVGCINNSQGEQVSRKIETTSSSPWKKKKLKKKFHQQLEEESGMRKSTSTVQMSPFHDQALSRLLRSRESRWKIDEAGTLTVRHQQLQQQQPNTPSGEQYSRDSTLTPTFARDRKFTGESSSPPRTFSSFVSTAAEAPIEQIYKKIAQENSKVGLLISPMKFKRIQTANSSRKSLTALQFVTQRTSKATLFAETTAAAMAIATTQKGSPQKTRKLQQVSMKLAFSSTAGEFFTTDRVNHHHHNSEIPQRDIKQETNIKSSSTDPFQMI